MPTLLPLLLLLLAGLAALGMAGCDMSPQARSANEVDLTQMGFAQHTMIIPAGTAVRFSNPAAGITHVLCIGANAACTPNAQGPAELTASDGLTLAAGQTKDVTFETPGTYAIACVLHPAMNLTVTVTQQGA
jgi:plastocyanin